MKKIATNELKSVLLKTLIRFDEFCKKNDLKLQYEIEQYPNLQFY